MTGLTILIDRSIERQTVQSPKYDLTKMRQSILNKTFFYEWASIGP